jgi:adenylate cyclase
VAREQRRLAAIVAADVVGYSRLMGRDESGTVARLKQNRAERLDPILAKYGGRLVKLTGDGALEEFTSAVDALSATIEFQQAMVEANSGQSPDTALVFRMGLHLGDLIVDGDDLYGDGVNVAARLEGEAPAGGILISRNVRDAVVGRVKATFEDLGGLSLKNIERPVRAFRVHWEASAWRPLAAPEVTVAPAVTSQSSPTLLPLPDKPSIAVLPFQNMSGDPEQEYFSDGITQDIITELSRFHSLFVIAHDSSLAYRERAADTSAAARDLGVRYVLYGSVRKAADRARITAQLVEADTGRHLWGERYDRSLEDVFAVQDEITHCIAAAVAPEVEASDHDRLTRQHPTNLRAWEIGVQAMALARTSFGKSDAEGIERAVKLADKAMAADLGCTRALCTLGYADWMKVHLRMVPAAARDGLLKTALTAIDRAIELDRHSHEPHLIKGLILGTAQRYDEALHAMRHAHELNPNDAWTLTCLGYTENMSGDPQAARTRLLAALRLNPKDPWGGVIFSALADACFMSGDYAQGIEWGLKAKHASPDFLMIFNGLALNYAAAGQIEEARKAIAAMQRLSPEYLSQRLGGESTYKRAEDRERATRFLRIAAGVDQA